MNKWWLIILLLLISRKSEGNDCNCMSCNEGCKEHKINSFKAVHEHECGCDYDYDNDRDSSCMERKIKRVDQDMCSCEEGTVLDEEL